MKRHHMKSHRLKYILFSPLILWASFVLASNLIADPDDTLSAVDTALHLVAEQQDLFNKTFIVYDDRDSGNEHFFPSGWMDDIAKVKEPEADTIIHGNCTNAPYSGTTCIQFTYPGNLPGKGWGGVFWEFPERQPLGPGYDLSRYKFPGEKVVLKFSAKAEKEGDIVVFAFRDVVDQEIKKVQFQTRLTTQWHQYAMNLSRCNLSNVTGGFAISTTRNKETRSIYADDIRIEFGPRGTDVRLSEPHFVRSYILTMAGAPDMYFRNSCFSYDNSLMAIAYCARGRSNDIQRAQSICDAFIEVQKRDKFHDGRIHNGYSCGDILDISRNDIPRPPGFWSDSDKQWFEDEYCAGTDCGNMAWAAIALLETWEKSGRKPQYLESALRVCEWIYSRYDANGIPGYRGGIEMVATNAEFPDGQSWIKWKSCEHNIDIFVAFERLAKAIGNHVWDERAQLAREFVLHMVEPADKHLWTGTGPEGTGTNKSIKPLDVNPWALLAFEDANLFGPSVEWAEKNCLVTVKTATGDIQGYDFKSKDFKLKKHLDNDPTNVDEHGIWWEGTAQMQLAFHMLGKKSQAEQTLEWLRLHANNSLEKGAVLATTTVGDGLVTGFRRMDKNETLWVYWNRPHVGGATCWYIFAELEWNPYWGRPVKDISDPRQ
jgi:hypothetical protein